MSSDGSITFPWADGEYRFRLAIGQLRELQDKSNAGPAELVQRLTVGTWRVDDIRETLRLGLIGGGTKPTEALVLVKRYVDDRPWLENVHPAHAVLMAALVGDPNEPVGKDEAAATEPETDGSPLPLSMDQEPS
jgi:hypothetical protein